MEGILFWHKAAVSNLRSQIEFPLQRTDGILCWHKLILTKLLFQIAVLRLNFSSKEQTGFLFSTNTHEAVVSNLRLHTQNFSSKEQTGFPFSTDTHEAVVSNRRLHTEFLLKATDRIPSQHRYSRSRCFKSPFTY